MTFLIVAVFGALSAYGQRNRSLQFEEIISAERVGLPAGNGRTSEPFVTRIYKSNTAGQVLKTQPDGYPFTITSEYKLKKGETARIHKGVDISSRALPDTPPTPLPFKAGVNGVVVAAGTGAWGTIAVQIHSGSVLQYLHTSDARVRVGDLVNPETVIGKTGKKGASAIHLHVQARNRTGSPILPDLVFRDGQHPLTSEFKATDENWRLDPDHWSIDRPQIEKGVITPISLPRIVWASEVIGAGGRVDLILGAYPTYLDAAYASMIWSVNNKNDLRLTREREVKLGE